MIRIPSICLLVLLAGAPILPAVAAPRYTLIERSKEIQVGWSQSHVVRVLGQPTSKASNTWFWLTKSGGFSITFKDGRVVRCGAMAG